MSITAKAIYLKSVLRFLAIVTAFVTSVIFGESEVGRTASFQQTAKYYPILTQLIDPFPPQVKTLALKSSHPFWNGHFLDATKKLRKIKKENEPGLMDGIVVIYHRYENFDLQIPAVMTIDWYKKAAFSKNAQIEFRDAFIKKIIS